MSFTRRRFPEPFERVRLYPRNQREADAAGRVLSTLMAEYDNGQVFHVLDNVTMEAETKKAFKFLVQGSFRPWAVEVWIPKSAIWNARFPPEAPGKRGSVKIAANFLTTIAKDTDRAIKRVLAGHPGDFKLLAVPDGVAQAPMTISGLFGTAAIRPEARFPFPLPDAPADPPDTTLINPTPPRIRRRTR